MLALTGSIYWIVKASENDSTNSDNTNNEHVDVFEDENFIVFNSAGEELDRISESQFDAGSTQTYKVTKSYTIDIIPNTTTNASNIRFTVNGETKNFKNLTSLMKGFYVVKNDDNSFTIDLSNGASLLNILERVCGSPVELDDADILKPDKIFTIVIRAVGSNDVRYIDFGLNTVIVTVSPDVVIIG